MRSNNPNDWKHYHLTDQDGNCWGHYAGYSKEDCIQQLEEERETTNNYFGEPSYPIIATEES